MHHRAATDSTAGRLTGYAFGVVVAVFALTLAAPLQADIRDTKHNLAKRFGHEATDEREVCVFCHFPAVGGLSTRSIEAPRWQRLAAGDYTFGTYADIGRAALDGAAPVGSQSVACLACHDSNQAFSVTRLSFDHPFGVPYRGARVSGSSLEDVREQARASGKPMREASFILGSASTDFRPAFESVVGNRHIFWASPAKTSFRRGKADLPLYPRRDNALGEDVPFVECSSCHDPHTTNDLFLRVTNSNSELCLTCHAK